MEEKYSFGGKINRIIVFYFYRLVWQIDSVMVFMYCENSAENISHLEMNILTNSLSLY